MYSVIKSGGFQQKVTIGETLKVPKLEAEVGSEISISDVLLVANGDKIEVGAPILDNASVKCEVLAHGKADKVKVFKKKRRQGYRRTQGHRQDFSEIIVVEIDSSAGKKSADKKAIERARVRAAAIAKAKEPAQKKAKSKEEQEG